MSGSAPGRREVAYRIFAAEFDDAELSHSESDEERAPNYVVSPTGARINRLFAVGVLTEVEDVNQEMIRGRLVDPTGAFVTYAGQYQPEALAALERAEPPAFFALSGKARTYEPDDGDRIYTSVRPESVSEVDAKTRDRWVVTTAERTLERIGVMASAIESGLAGEQLRAALVHADIDDRLADGVALALDYYGTSPEYLAALREVAIDAVRVVAGERDEVGRLELAPGEGAGDPSALATVDLSGAPSPGTAAAAAAAVESDGEGEPAPTNGETLGATGVEADSEPTSASSSAESSESETDPVDRKAASEIGGESADERSAGAETEIESEPGSVSEPTDEPTAEPELEPESEPELDTASEPAVQDDEREPDAEAEAELDDFDPAEFELDEEERREVEEEFGTEFSTADEVEPADIEPEGVAEEPADVEAEPDVPETEAETPVETETDADETVPAEESVAAQETDTDEGQKAVDEGLTADEPTAEGDVDLSAAVMDAMKRLDDGDGADKADLVATVAEEAGVDEDAVAEAIQDALMSGQCYEPADGTLKPI
ncbi:RPA family protein [Natronomonas salsuginis]|uniref:Rpa-associated protein n=1 Tax=Natronomonas salsuginis TaxID=2217661 RepID=A0A4U5JBZ5_9EURY|nr:hypothetical protein [Natronomonas salsuginis]TKR26394.1 hypothetical protein DM868_07865 [Natronomonas salsuginis]